MKRATEKDNPSQQEAKNQHDHKPQGDLASCIKLDMTPFVYQADSNLTNHLTSPSFTHQQPHSNPGDPSVDIGIDHDQPYASKHFPYPPADPASGPVYPPVYYSPTYPDIPASELILPPVYFPPVCQDALVSTYPPAYSPPGFQVPLQVDTSPPVPSAPIVENAHQQGNTERIAKIRDQMQKASVNKNVKRLLFYAAMVRWIAIIECMICFFSVILLIIPICGYISARRLKLIPACVFFVYMVLIAIFKLILIPIISHVEATGVLVIVFVIELVFTYIVYRFAYMLECFKPKQRAIIRLLLNYSKKQHPKAKKRRHRTHHNQPAEPAADVIIVSTGDAVGGGSFDHYSEHAGGSSHGGRGSSGGDLGDAGEVGDMGGDVGDINGDLGGDLGDFGGDLGDLGDFGGDAGGDFGGDAGGDFGGDAGGDFGGDAGGGDAGGGDAGGGDCGGGDAGGDCGGGGGD